MSHTKLIAAAIVGTVTLAGIVTAKWMQGRNLRTAAKSAGNDLLKQHPDLVVRMLTNKIQRLRDEGASAEAIMAAELKLARAEMHLAEQKLADSTEAGVKADQQLDASMNRIRAFQDNQPEANLQ